MVSYNRTSVEIVTDFASFSITIVSAATLYFILWKENKRRAALALNDVDRDKFAFHDLTDKENPYFTYML
jgi:cbb3-type cytochrome oxidase subunit 3